MGISPRSSAAPEYSPGETTPSISGSWERKGIDNSFRGSVHSSPLRISFEIRRMRSLLLNHSGTAVRPPAEPATGQGGKMHSGNTSSSPSGPRIPPDFPRIRQTADPVPIAYKPFHVLRRSSGTEEEKGKSVETGAWPFTAGCRVWLFHRDGNTIDADKISLMSHARPDKDSSLFPDGGDRSPSEVHCRIENGRVLLRMWQKSFP